MCWFATGYNMFYHSVSLPWPKKVYLNAWVCTLTSIFPESFLFLHNGRILNNSTYLVSFERVWTTGAMPRIVPGICCKGSRTVSGICLNTNPRQCFQSAVREPSALSHWLNQTWSFLVFQLKKKKNSSWGWLLHKASVTLREWVLAGGGDCRIEKDRWFLSHFQIIS